MAGLAFPQDATFHRGASNEDGTPISNGDDIPIDPALTGVIDPVLMAESAHPMKVEQHPTGIPEVNSYPSMHVSEEPEVDQVRQYSQTPQGDPFAPEVPLPFLQYQVLAPEPPPPTTKQKRKRKARREEECGACGKGEASNLNGEPERLMSCIECRRTVHLSCAKIVPLVANIIQLYPYRCIDCKICEVCHEKGADDRILFCDVCERGWHMDCINPPLSAVPDAFWPCPDCQQQRPELFEEIERQKHEYEQLKEPQEEKPNGIPPDMSMPIPMQVEESVSAPSIGRGTSVASTSQSALHEPTEVVTKPRKGRPPGRPRGRPPKPKPAPPPEVEEDAMDVVDEATPVQPKSTSTRTRTVKRPRAAREAREELSDEDDGEPQSSPLRTRRRKQPPPAAKEPSPAPTLPRVRLRLPNQMKGKGKERAEEDDSEGRGMFDDILNEQDRDTSKTQITRFDTALFEKSRQLAEEKLRPPPTSAVPPTTAGGRSTATASDHFDFSTPGPSARPLRSAALHHLHTNIPPTPNGLSASPGPSTPGGPVPLRMTDPKTLRIHTIRFGEYDIKTWYDAPFPEEYATIPDGRLWICEFCLKYMKSRFGALRHRIKCKARHPPGDEIYRDGNVSIFEVDGRRNKIYCQNLCLLSKMFLDHKSLFYDVEPFLFYVITELDEVGYRFVGYFSKEKRSPKDYNVSCIMTLPVRQRKGWGNLLIDFSYLLSKKEERSGSPEKPLSNLGAIGYRKYWTLAVMRYLQHAPDQVRLEDIRVATSMTLEDICQTLTEQNMLYIRDASPGSIRPSPGQAIRFPKGRKNGIARRQLQRMQTNDSNSDSSKGPFVPPKHYEIHFDRQKVAAYLADWERKGYLKLKPEKLQWTPYLLSRGSQESGMVNETPALATSLEASSSVEQPQSTASPNGVDQDEPMTSLNLFSSSPPPPEDIAEVEDEAEEEDDDELPVPRKKLGRPRTRSPKKKRSPVKKPRAVVAVAEAAAVEEETVTPRRKRGRPSQTPANGVIVSPESERPSRIRRPTARVIAQAEEEEEQTPRLRSSRSKPSLAEPVEPSPPKKARGRKRQRIESPVEEEEEEEKEEEEVETSVLNGIETKAEPSEAAPSDVSEVNGMGDETQYESSSYAAASVSSETGPVFEESSVRSTAIPDEELCDEDAEGEDEEEDAEGEIYDESDVADGLAKVRTPLSPPTGHVPQHAHSDNAMQYPHISRDQNLDSNNNTPFQTHQGLGQALGTHLAPPPPQYARGGPDAYRHPSTSPPTLNQPHAGSSGHQGIAFAVSNPQQTSPALKRKQMDQHAINNSNTQVLKRRKDGGGGDDGDGFDDAGGQGAKHWTDDEKTKLFQWLMGPHNDDHWTALRATKNSCLRDCADKVFGRKKTYQALKGCYERNFNLFKQIYALEQSLNHPGAVRSTSEPERLREYERRLNTARKAGCDVGNITSRTVEHWFSRGWYQLFYSRWNGDPATTRPIQTRSSGSGNHAPQVGDDQDDDDAPLDFGNSEPSIIVNGINGMSHDRQQQQQQPPPQQQQQQQQQQQAQPQSHQVAYINPQNLGRDVSQMPPTPQTGTGQVTMVSTPNMQPQHSPPNSMPNNTPNHNHAPPPPPPPHHQQPQQHPQQPSAPPSTGMQMPVSDSSATTLLPIPFNPQTVNAFMQYLSSQTQLNKMKIEYMRRREEREEKEHRTKYEAGRIQLEKEKLELEEKKHTVLMKQKSEKAVELLGRPEIDQTVKAAAAVYLRKLFEE